MAADGDAAACPLSPCLPYFIAASLRDGISRFWTVSRIIVRWPVSTAGVDVAQAWWRTAKHARTCMPLRAARRTPHSMHRFTAHACSTDINLVMIACDLS